MKSCFWLVGWLVIWTSVSAAAAEKLDFNRDIRPILSDKCYRCHGFDEKKREAGLRLDVLEGATQKLESGASAVVPGKSGESQLLTRITTSDKDLKMPPESTGKTLSADEIAKLKRWIDEGAEYKPHWSFIPPSLPPIPKVKQSAAVRNPIDAFIVARLEQAKLSPSVPADKNTLIRRVTLEITGLPPTPEEVAAYLADESPEAFEKVVDRLLKSPRFGEHMARYWLDAARYGDTHGLHLDNERGIWPYREYVIRAFNDNLPINQFITEQMAGDLLPNPTQSQKVATGFNRCNVTTSEGGSINDEVLVRYAVDRVETMSTVFLGLTLGCSVCHDHKYDPVTQKEFYQLYAFFASSADAAMDGNTLLPPPFLRMPTPEQEKKLAEIEPAIKEITKTRDQRLKQLVADYVDPGATPTDDSKAAKDVVWIDDDLPKGARKNAEWKYLTKEEFSEIQSGSKVHTQTGTGTVQHFFTGANPPLVIAEGDKLFAYVYLDPKSPPKTVMLQWNDGSWEHRAFWGEDAIAYGSNPKSAGHLHVGPLPELGKWVRLEVAAADVGLPAGAKINGWAFTQADGTVMWDHAGVNTTGKSLVNLESFIVWDAQQRALKENKLPKPEQAALKIVPEKRNAAQKKQLLEYFLKNVHPKAKSELEGMEKSIAELTGKKTELEKSIPASLIMQELDKPRESFVLIRGQYDKKGEKVSAAIPAALGKLPEGAPANRLGLAQWLTDPQHPLTARVFVNRVWQQIFGTGLVKTAEDFGSQGQLPSHPELLDYLSRQFIDQGWDLKRLVKEMVMSGTYQQSSRVTPELLQKDPSNELLSRGPRFRFDAEMVRDNALFLSGLLNETIGGKSVKPYQPEGLWEAVGFRSSNTLTFKQDQGAALYRRSLYSFWKRTSPPPAMMSFDAPSRESCVVRRARTNTPLQALVLMNDVQFVEAARFFAQRMLVEGGGSPAERLQFGFRLATARLPNERELGVLTRVFETHLADFSANKEAAEKLVKVGEGKTTVSAPANELAAYTLVANLILNLDETVTKE